MANLASLLEQHSANPEKILYRQYIDDAWRDFSAADVWPWRPAGSRPSVAQDMSRATAWRYA